jgi:LCP family protein required for cell wall assembly
MKVLVLGVDSPFGGVPKGADAIRLVKVDFSEKEIVVVAMPRDLWVSTEELADYDIEEERLGLTYYYGKLYSNDDETAATNILAQTIYDNFEVAPDYYFNIHMDSFAEMVDEIGGIDIIIPARFHTPSGDIEAGAQTLDGLMTMEYARTMLIDTEWDRLDRQNLVLHALRDEILSLDILPKVPELFAQFENVITTDLSPEQLVDLSCMVDEVPQENILLLEIGSEMVEIDDEGVMYPDFEKIIEFLQGIFGSNGS